MDAQAMQSATREMVKKRFGRKSLLPSKAIPHFPDSLEREYVRVVDAYMKLLGNAFTAHLKATHALYGGLRADADEPQSGQPAIVPSAAGVTVSDIELDQIIASVFKEFEYGQGAFDLYGKLKRVANHGSKLSVAEWKRMVKHTLGINLMEDYYNGAKFQQLTERWIAENVSLIKTMSDDALNQMLGIVREGFMSGSTLNSLTNNVLSVNPTDFGFKPEMTQEAYDKAMAEYQKAKRHARFIARDQTAKLNAQITRQQQEDAGVIQYVWRTTGDSRVRERHRELNNKRFKYSEPPIVDERTGRRENPGGDYQCRCVALPVFDLETVSLPWEYEADKAANKL